MTHYLLSSEVARWPVIETAGGQEAGLERSGDSDDTQLRASPARVWFPSSGSPGPRACRRTVEAAWTPGLDGVWEGRARLHGAGGRPASFGWGWAGAPTQPAGRRGKARADFLVMPGVDLRSRGFRELFPAKEQGCLDLRLSNMLAKLVLSNIFENSVVGRFVFFPLPKKAR